MNKRKLVLISSVVFNVFLFLNIQLPLSAEQTYFSEILYTIPWGEQTGQITDAWNADFTNAEGDFVDPPSPFIISPSNKMIIDQYDGYNSKLLLFSNCGYLIAGNSNVASPNVISISNNENILIAEKGKLVLLDTDLNIIRKEFVPFIEGGNNRASIYGLFPSNNNTFWVLYNVHIRNQDDSLKREIYFGEYSEQGFIFPPNLVYEGDSFPGYRFVTPDGQIRLNIEDMYGFYYSFNSTPSLTRISPQHDVVFSHTLESAPGWTAFDERTHYFVSWSGDFYTLHATESGAVLTKYDLHVDPVCNLLVITPRPHTGPSPVAIEFDASGTYDDDGDTLTFHWDFDGDKVFDEPIDDAYTGTPSNPTHEYTADFEGPVCLKVTDNYQGECEMGVVISVDVE